jgi:hypothetical protein
VDVASNKLRSFATLKTHGVSCPEFTTSADVAQHWLHDGRRVLARTILRGSCGNGIVDIDPFTAGFPYAPLYVEYVKKSREFRVHTTRDPRGGYFTRTVEKRRRTDFDGEIDNRIRNHSRGWVFCQENVQPDESVVEESAKAIEALGLDFGAVDVIWNEHYQKAYVLEVNTAPGLEGSTVGFYADALTRLIDA